MAADGVFGGNTGVQSAHDLAWKLAADPRTAGGRPGTRGPHVVLRRGATELSTLDLHGTGFVLLAGPAGAAWTEGVEEACAHLGLPVAAHVVGSGSGLADPHGAFLAARGITASGAVLVRPDGSWGGGRAPPGPIP